MGFWKAIIKFCDLFLHGGSREKRLFAFLKIFFKKII